MHEQTPDDDTPGLMIIRAQSPAELETHALDPKIPRGARKGALPACPKGRGQCDLADQHADRRCSESRPAQVARGARTDKGAHETEETVDAMKKDIVRDPTQGDAHRVKV